MYLEINKKFWTEIFVMHNIIAKINKIKVLIIILNDVSYSKVNTYIVFHHTYCIFIFLNILHGSCFYQRQVGSHVLTYVYHKMHLALNLETFPNFFVFVLSLYCKEMNFQQIVMNPRCQLVCDISFVSFDISNSKITSTKSRKLYL